MGWICQHRALDSPPSLISPLVELLHISQKIIDHHLVLNQDVEVRPVEADAHDPLDRIVDAAPPRTPRSFRIYQCHEAVLRTAPRFCTRSVRPRRTRTRRFSKSILQRPRQARSRDRSQSGSRKEFDIHHRNLESPRHPPLMKRPRHDGAAGLTEFDETPTGLSA